MSELIVLMIDDDDNDVRLVKHAMSKSGAGHTVRAVYDGESAVQYLRGEANYSDRIEFPLPNIVLCDLKMPRMGGFEFLQWMRNNPECSVIPTIVFSSSHMQSDVRKAYRLGANSYIVKPTGLSELAEILRKTFEYWSQCACPPIPSTVETAKASA